MKKLQIKTLSSLAKVFSSRICGRVSYKTDAACGQSISFQVAYRLQGLVKYAKKGYSVVVESPLENISRFHVREVASNLPVYPERTDKNYITTKPGLFPDPLVPADGEGIVAASEMWRALWFTVAIPETCQEGVYPVKVTFLDDNGEIAAETTYRIKVHAVSLPAQSLLFTQWFHCDCIADIHGVPVFSEEHWTLIGKYMKLAADHGMNMILTPVVTPPLDTAVGHERPTVQLVEIEKQGETYTFDFTRLRRYVAMALDCGIKAFEIGHLFTQWGVAHAPKVVARVDGEEKRIFGWETDAQSEEYVAFLNLLVPALIEAMLSAGISKDQLWFHVSDEPHKEHLEPYRKGAEVLKPLIKGCHHMDALSDLDFYNEGLLESPVAATNRIEPFLEANVPGLWCYYCCSQCVDVSNRFFAMPSARTRIIGVQMFKYGIAGFLQWGYNFYYTARSQRMVDPYRETCGDQDWPSGDPFSVYPLGDDVIPSLRQKVFANALEDLRLLQLLEQKLGHERAVAEVEKVAMQEITFASYPKQEEFFDALYQMIFSYLD